jgi:hypothetical protein
MAVTSIVTTARPRMNRRAVSRIISAVVFLFTKRIRIQPQAEAEKAIAAGIRTPMRSINFPISTPAKLGIEEATKISPAPPEDQPNVSITYIGIVYVVELVVISSFQ